MPGVEDFVSVKQKDGSPEQVQQWLVLCNHSELFPRFWI